MCFISFGVRCSILHTPLVLTAQYMLQYLEKCVFLFFPCWSNASGETSTMRMSQKREGKNFLFSHFHVKSFVQVRLRHTA